MAHSRHGVGRADGGGGAVRRELQHLRAGEEEGGGVRVSGVFLRRTLHCPADV